MLPFHPNALTFTANLISGEEGPVCSGSRGTRSAAALIVRDGESAVAARHVSLPHPIHTAPDLLRWCDATGRPVSWLVW